MKDTLSGIAAVVGFFGLIALLCGIVWFAISLFLGIMFPTTFPSWSNHRAEVRREFIKDCTSQGFTSQQCEWLNGNFRRGQQGF